MQALQIPVKCESAWQCITLFRSRAIAVTSHLLSTLLHFLASVAPVFLHTICFFAFVLAKPLITPRQHTVATTSADSEVCLSLIDIRTSAIRMLLHTFVPSILSFLRNLMRIA